MIERSRFTNQEIEQKLCALGENELSQNILLPLFEKVFSGSAQFTGGPDEKGRDLLITRSDELGETQYIAVQVKKLKITSNTQKSGSFQQLLLQLSQASSEPVIDLVSGCPVMIDRLFFVTPFTISQSTLDSHQSTFRKVTERCSCKIIDGAKLASLIKENRPDLINVLFEPTYILTSSIRDKLKNEPLMKALDKHLSRDISEIYCDLSFFFGNKLNGNRILFEVTSRNKEKEFRIKIEDAEKYKQLNETFLNLYGNELFNLSHLKINRLTVLEENQIRESKKRIENEIKEIEGQISSEIHNLGLKVDFAKDLLRASRHHGADYKISLNDLVKENPEFTQSKRKEFSECIKPLRAKLLPFLRERERLSEDLEQTHANLILYAERLSDCLNGELEYILKNSPSTVEQCRETLKRVLAIQEIFLFTQSLPDVFREIKQNTSPEDVRLDIPLETVFKTGLNIAVLGEAGSGKTTSLQMYARQLLMNDDERFVLYIPLIELGNHCGSRPINILMSLTAYLQSLTIQITLSDVQEYLNSGTSVLLLDSVDEGIAVYPEIIESLSTFVKSYPKCQVITSSRTLVLRNNVIPFNQVTLLPFNNEQLLLFFQKWFYPDKQAPLVIEDHLKCHNKLSKEVTNPLSATILCVLYENGVPLPRSEASLYNTRLELLAGKFDREKKVFRLINAPNAIVDFAKLVGYEMHKLKLRSAAPNEIRKFLLNSSNEVLTQRIDIDSLIQDFLTSEIMIHTSESNLSFGHLRFQEFLASEELKNRRSFPADKLLRDSWWAGALLIYAQTAREVDWLFNHAITNAYSREVKYILRSIASVRPKTEKEALVRRLNIALQYNDEEF
jgi:hypothetical protein